MSDVKKIAECIKSGNHVALWGASNDAILIVNELENDYSLLPDLFIDSDKNKQGKCFMGIHVVSFNEAKQIQDNLYIYIVASNYKYQIIGELVHGLNFPKENIINYEPVVWKKGCMYIENAFQCVGNSMCFCSSDFGKKQSPRVYFQKDYEYTIGLWNKLRQEISTALETGEECSCSGCCCVKEDWYAEKSKIHIVNYSEGGICNFKCVYCNAAAKTSAKVDDSEIDIAETLEVLNKNQLLADDLHIDYSPGEPALHSKREKYYNSFCGKYTTLIMTNASVYDSSIAKCLAEGKASLCVSLDAGTRATFSNVKGRDMFDKVKENLVAYSKEAKGTVGLKYIFLPDENDTLENVEGFVNICKEIRPAIVLLSYDIFHPIQTLPEHTYKMVIKMIELLDSEGIVWKNVSDVIARALKGE